MEVKREIVSELKKRKSDEPIEPETGLSKITKFKKLNPSLTNKTVTLYSKREIESVLPNIKIFPNFCQRV